jgi:hypothetical protein
MVSPSEWFADCPEKELRRLLELYRPKGTRLEIETVIEHARQAFSNPSRQNQSIDSLLTNSWQLAIADTPKGMAVDQEKTTASGQWVHRTVLLPNQLDQALLFHSFFQVPRSRQEVEARLIADELTAQGTRDVDIDTWLSAEPSSTKIVDTNGMAFEERPGCRAVVIEIPKELDDMVVAFAQNIGARPSAVIRTSLSLGLAKHSIVSGWVAPPLPSLQLVFPPKNGAVFRICRKSAESHDYLDLARLVIRGDDAAVAMVDHEPGLTESISEILWILRERLKSQPTPEASGVSLEGLPLPSGARIEALESDPFIDVLEELGQHAAFLGGDRWMGGHGCDVHIVIAPESPLLRDLHMPEERNARSVIGLTVSSNAAPELLQSLAQVLAKVVWRTPLLCNPPEPLDVTGGDAVGAVVGILTGLGFEAVISYVPLDEDQVDPGSVEVRLTSGYPSVDRVVLPLLQKVCEVGLDDDLGDELE